MKFINRKQELEFLEKKYNSGEAELIVIYGRRRIGKTELLVHFSKGKNYFYFLGRLESREESIRRMNNLLMSHFKDFELAKRLVSDWDDVFEYLARKSNKRLVVVFDEFPFIAERFPEIVSVLQDKWDAQLRHTKIMLVLCGSSIGMMEKHALSYKSPLYGRRTGQWMVDRMNVKHIREFFPEYKMEDLILVYSALDMIPGYLVKFSPADGVWKNIRERILSKGEFLYEEVEILMREEFRDPSNYMSIISSIAGGATTFGEINSITGLDKSLLSKYLYILDRLHIIERQFPVTATVKSKLKGKKSLYSIRDNFFDFWFRFVFPNKQELEEGKVDDVLETIKNEIDSYIGFKFERFVKEIVSDLVGFRATRSGRWWHKDKEIDIVALNEQTKQVLFVECKWKDRVNAKKIVKELAEKSSLVDWYNDEREEKFAVFAKSFSDRVEEFEGRKVYCFDLKDLERYVKS